jgi:molybdenum cofactor cytidylyltransferase
LSGDLGALSVVHAHEALKLALSDRGCVTDIDTLDDLWAAQRLLDET